MNPAARTRATDVSRWGLVQRWCGSAGLGRRHALSLALCWALWCGGTLPAQRSGTGGNGQVSGRTIAPSLAIDENPTGSLNNPVFEERRLRQLTLSQHKAMVSDADRLLKLVTELKEEIDSSSPAELTPDQLRRVAEIEKLARSVKDKMKNSVQGIPAFVNGPPPISNSPGRR